MTIEEYDDLMEGDIVHFINDNPNTHSSFYDYKIMHITSNGMMIESEKSVPQFLDKEEALEKLKIHKDAKIESWKLDVEADSSEAWTGELTVTLDRYYLNLIVKALRCAAYEGVIDDSDRDRLLEKLNIDDN